MSGATVTSKGQITIPAEVRRDLRVKPGSRVEFVRRDDGVYELVPKSRSITALRGVVRASEPVTLEQMDGAIARGAVG